MTSNCLSDDLDLAAEMIQCQEELVARISGVIRDAENMSKYTRAEIAQRMAISEERVNDILDNVGSTKISTLARIMRAFGFDVYCAIQLVSALDLKD